MRLSLLLDLVLPPSCVACGGGETLVCDECRRDLVFLGPPLCARCGAPTAWPVERCAECAGRRLPFRSARAAVAYEGPAARIVRAWKERGLRRLAHEAALLTAGAVPPPAADAVAFVPGEAERTAWRGANTAESLAHELGELWSLPVACVLGRAGRSPRQRGLSRAARRANVRGAFAARGAVPRRLVLVDDVYTTGATVGAAATELRRAGARSIDVVTFARTVRRAA